MLTSLATVIAASSDASLVAIWIALALIVLLLYFLPTYVALRRKLPNKGAVIVINLFFGWTFLGWVIALAMAYGRNKEPVQQIMYMQQPPTNPDQPKPPSTP